MPGTGQGCSIHFSFDPYNPLTEVIISSFTEDLEKFKLGEEKLGVNFDGFVLYSTIKSAILPFYPLSVHENLNNRILEFLSDSSIETEFFVTVKEAIRTPCSIY